jgi:hypothetical protein
MPIVIKASYLESVLANNSQKLKRLKNDYLLAITNSLLLFNQVNLFHIEITALLQRFGISSKENENKKNY